MNRGALTAALAGALVFLGAFLPLWPLGLLGVLLAAAAGQWWFAVFCGLLLDLLFGPAMGFWHIFYVPFTVAAVLAALLRLALRGRMRSCGRTTL